MERDRANAVLESQGNIFNIQRYSIHDGQGIRTLVFFKGCPLRCIWCANPESQLFASDISISQHLCIQCGKCIKNCPTQAITIQTDGVVINRDRCTRCGHCAKNCNAECLRLVGKQYTVKELIKEIQGDRVFYNASDGGVTFSGGEPFSQADFLLAVLQECKTEGIDTAVETCGFAPFEKIAPCLPYIDTILYDIKHMDSIQHECLTGVDNRLILDNARKIAAAGVNMVIRVPVVPGINDSLEHLYRIVDIAKEMGISSIHLLPYHDFGRAKYLKMGLTYKLDIKPPSQVNMEKLKKTLSRRGISVQIGG